MGTRLYVGGLPFSMRDEALKAMFEETCGTGTVKSARVICDRETGKSRGFGFVEMMSVEEAGKAIDLFKDRMHEGRRIKVDKAEERSGGGGGGGFKRGGNGNYGGGRDSGGYGGGY